ncbi:hypothetical protein RHSIM_Rhsim01G0080600 [Rhododendron simsii]|uniref:CCHC-type domain-containing protein n=1 Tax=Rhododendron simsii TaxID=118357 RepID=A0A834HLA3_RHOSS|nr:hypothetical protein RHSIM_Rhsim01G0080600 [Rhododendron simsii]
MASETFAQPVIPRFDGHYDHWSMLMENFLRSKEYWTVVVSGVAEPAEGVVLTDAQKAELEGLKLKDLKAKNYLFQAIDRSILETILCKDSAKHIWDSMKKKYQGSARAKRLQLQAYRLEFEMLRMKSGESVTDYFSRTMTIVNKMRIHGDKTTDVTVVEKILRSMATKFNFVVCSIEEANDIDELSIDELQSSLLVHEQKINQQEKEEQALKASSENHSTTNRADRARGRGRGRGRGGRGNNDRGNQQHHQNQENQFQGRGRGRGGFHSTSYGPKSADKFNVECYKCHRYGHYQSECRTNLNRQSGERTNFAEKEEEVSLLMVCHVKEETPQNMWYLDTGCSNHMCGDKKLFSNLDESFRNTVKFGDNSTVAVMGKGSVTIQPKGNLTHTISNVLFVPNLKTNLLSVGQLQEKGYEISIKGGVCQIQDAKLGLIAQVNMMANHMFPLHLHNTNHSCFSANVRDAAWLWHFGYGHLNFGGLKTLQHKNMVIGLPQIAAPSGVCEECVVSKQHQQIPTSFDGDDDDDAKQSQQQLVPAIAGLENPQNEAPMASEITPTTPEVDEQVEAVAGSRSQRVRKRPAWMSDYEIPGIDQSDDPLTHFALFSDCDPTIFESALKNYNSVSTPTEFGLKLTKDHDGKKVDSTLYKQIAGSLMYLTATRPDIMYSVSLIIRYMENPTELHLLVAKRIFRYLQGTWKFGLFYKNGERSDLRGFTDSDYAGDQDDRRSTSGYVFMLGSGAVSWSSKKQPIVTLSTTEAEFVAATSCVCQAIWLKKILEELYFKRQGAITIFCDNSSAIKLSKNPVLHGRSKHIDVKFHFLRDHTKDGTIDLIFCKSEDQVADIMTKPLKLGMFMKLRSLLGVCSMENPI